MGIWSGLVGMEGGYVATALVMLMSPVFFPVLVIIAPVAPSLECYFSLHLYHGPLPTPEPGEKCTKYLFCQSWEPRYPEVLSML